MSLKNEIINFLSKEGNVKNYHTIYEIINDSKILEILDADFVDLTNDIIRENKEVKAIAKMHKAFGELIEEKAVSVRYREISGTERIQEYARW